MTATFTIHETAKLSGILPSTLQIWELRYGWPKPARKANGYRTYHASLIKDLQWAASCIAAGKTIRELIDDDAQLIQPTVTEKKKSLRLHPTDRELAITAVLRAARNRVEESGDGVSSYAPSAG